MMAKSKQQKAMYLAKREDRYLAARYPYLNRPSIPPVALFRRNIHLLDLVKIHKKKFGWWEVIHMRKIGLRPDRLKQRERR